MSKEHWRFMDKDTLVADFYVDLNNFTISDYKVYVDEDDLAWRSRLPFYCHCTQPTFADFLDFVYEHLPSENRADIDDILEHFGLDVYDCIKLIHKTHGIMFEDTEWVQFDNEDLKFADIDFLHRSE